MKNSLKWQWIYQKRIYLLIFAIPFLIMYIVYASFGVHPYGDESVLVLDLNGQYVYYFEYLRDCIWGDSSAIYSWSRNLSGEMFGIFAYYLASPFTIIPMLLPRTMMLGALELMQLCKIGACAVTFAIYLKHRQQRKTFTLILFSILYSLMSYCVVQLMNPMWIDGLIYLPLIVLGVEVLIDEGRKLQLIIPLALMFMANFYIGYMIGIFTALYFAFYCLNHKDVIIVKNLAKTIARFIISVVVAVMSAMVIIYPVYNSLKLGKLEFTTPDFTLKTQFNLVEFFTKLLPMSYDTVRPEGLPILYCGVLTLMLLPLYFLNRNIDAKKKVCNAIFLTTILLSMYLSTVDLAWHGFQIPNWLPYRYSFVFCFLLLVMAAEAFEHLEGISYREIGGSFFGLFIFIIYLESQNFEHIKIFGAIWFSILAIAIYFAMLFVCKKYNNKVSSILMIAVVAVELYSVSLHTLYEIDIDVVYSKYSSYKGYIETGRDIMDEIEEFDNSLYRTEKTYDRTVNDPMAFGMKGISHSSSTMNAGAIELLKQLGFTSRGHFTKYHGATPITDALFGIKYILNKDKIIYDYNLVSNHDDVLIYENPNALSIGFMANDAVRYLALAKPSAIDNLPNTKRFGINPFENQNMLLSSMLYDYKQSYFVNIDFSTPAYDNVLVQTAGDHYKYSPIIAGNNADIEFTITAPTDDVIYMFLPSKYERTMNIWVNNGFIDTFYEGDNYCIMPLGKFEAGEEISIITTLTKDDAYMIDQYFYYFDNEKFQSAINELNQREWNITKWSDTYLEGDITANENEIMVTTIPYENGWTIKVDGKKVTPIKLVDSLIGIEVPAGKHIVTMKFFPTYLTMGIIASILGVIAIVIIAILERKSKGVLLNRLLK